MAESTLSPEEICKFETQDPDESALLLLRAHIITNLGWILVVIFLSLVPLLFLNTDLFKPLFEQFNLSGAAARSLALLWYLFVVAFAVQSILYWYFNVYIVSSKRIVDVDFLQLLYKKISSTELGNVQDISTTKGGVFQAIFDYGDVHIQTAGTLPEFEFNSVPSPDKVADTIETAKGKVNNI